MAKSKLPSMPSGDRAVTEALMKFGKILAKTPKRIYDSLVGPEQEQNYGWTEQFFPSKPKKEKDNKTTTVTSTENLGPVPTMGMDTEEILNLMKENYADEKRYREVQKGFEEARAGEEEKRHKELVTALKKFTGTKTTATPVAKGEEGGGFLDTIMNMFKALQEKINNMLNAIEEKIKSIFDFFESLGGKKLIFDMLSKLGTVLANPFTIALLGGALASWFATMIASDPNFQKAFKDNMLLGATSGDTGLATNILSVAAKDEKEKTLVDGANSIRNLLLEDAPVLAKKLDIGSRDYLVRVKGLTQEEADFLMPGNSQDEEKFGTVTEREIILKGIQEKFYKRKESLALPEGVKPSYAGAGRGGSAQLEDYTRNQLIEKSGEGAAFGVRPQGIKAAPVPPPPTPVAQLTDMNRDLEMYTSPMGDVAGPIIQQSNTQSAKNEPPIASTATQRNDEPMSSKVLKDQRTRARAY